MEAQIAEYPVDQAPPIAVVGARNYFRRFTAAGSSVREMPENWALSQVDQFFARISGEDGGAGYLNPNSGPCAEEIGSLDDIFSDFNW